MRIGITYNLKSDIVPPLGSTLPEDALEEFDLPKTVEALQEILEGEGHKVFLLGGNLSVAEKVKDHQIEFVFNIAEGFQGRNREAHIPALLELLEVPYSGSDPLGLALTLDKALTKRIALSLGIPTPEFWVLDESREVEQIPDQFPLFVKPLWQGSSKGIRETSRVEDKFQLNREINRLFENYPGEPALVEKYIPGREFTVGVIGNDSPEILGVMEIAFRDPGKKDFCYSLEVKRDWKALVEYRFPARLDSVVELRIREATEQLFKTLRLRDVARFDFRVNPQGQFYFLEANPLPGLAPDSGDIVLLSQKKGWSYQELILKIARAALSRYCHLADLKETKTKP